jgi:hypothetical protein
MVASVRSQALVEVGRVSVITMEDSLLGLAIFSLHALIQNGRNFWRVDKGLG